MRPFPFVLAVCLVTVACLGDPPPAPEDRPLEIVVHPQECLLNYPSIGPGTHEVTVIVEGTSGSVEIIGDSGVVYSSEQDGTAGSVELESGNYTIECETEGHTTTARLEVSPSPP